jgi:hypothetical protein
VNDWRSDWKPFDYRYSSVIMPIAEKFDCFPFRHPFDREVWCARTAKNIGDSNVRADTPQKAIALAVIGAKK